MAKPEIRNNTFPHIDLRPQFLSPQEREEMESKLSPITSPEQEDKEYQDKIDGLLVSLYPLSLALFDQNADMPDVASRKLYISMPDRSLPFYMVNKHGENASTDNIPEDNASVSIKKTSLDGMLQKTDFIYLTVQKPFARGFFVLAKDHGQIHLPYSNGREPVRLKQRVQQLQALHDTLQNQL